MSEPVHCLVAYAYSLDHYKVVLYNKANGVFFLCLWNVPTSIYQYSFLCWLFFFWMNIYLILLSWILSLSPSKKLSSDEFLFYFNIQSASMSLKLSENVVWAGVIINIQANIYKSGRFL